MQYVSIYIASFFEHFCPTVTKVYCGYATIKYNIFTKPNLLAAF